MSGILVLVLGGNGMMGKRIAAFLALQGQTVNVWDRTPPNKQEILDLVNEEVRTGAYLQEEGEHAIQRLSCTDDLKVACQAVDLVIEAIIEDLEIKIELFQRVELLVRPETVMTSNTMSISITDLAERLAFKARFIGLRFLYPVMAIPDVEITAGLQTSNETIDQVMSWVRGMDMSPFYRAPGNGNYLRLDDDVALKRQQVWLAIRTRRRIERADIPLEGPPPPVPTAAQLYYADGDDARARELARETEGSEPAANQDVACIICLVNARTHLLYPCGHRFVCLGCARRLQQQGHRCPNCRRGIADYVRVYE